jgi:hypothetical protein
MRSRVSLRPATTWRVERGRGVVEVVVGARERGRERRG